MMDGWKKGKLSDVSVVFSGYAFKSKDMDTEKGIPLLKIKNINYNKVSKDCDTYLNSKAFTKNQNKYLLVKDDILVAMTGQGSVGRIGKMREIDKTYLVNQRVGIVRVDEKLADAEYVFQFMGRSEIENVYFNLAMGAGQPNLSPKDIGNLEITFPPLPTQKKIAKILSAYDDLIENNLKRIKLLEEMAQITYEEWFVRMKFPEHENAKFDKETGLPEGWKKVKCIDIMEVLSGGTPKTTEESYWNGEIQFYTPKDASSMCYTTRTEKTITKNGLKKCNSKLYPKNTVFITARGTVGKVNLAAQNMAMNQSCYALKAKNSISQFYLYEAIKSTVNLFKTAASGGVFDTIVVDTFRVLPFTLPPIQLIDRFTKIVGQNYDAVHN